MYLIFDTETTGLPQRYDAPIEDLDNWPRLVQLAWQLHDANGNLLSAGNRIVKPEGFTIPFNSEKVHGISTEMALKEGYPLGEVLKEFEKDVAKAEILVGHNVDFDIHIVGAEMLRASHSSGFMSKRKIDTKDESTDYVAIPGRGGRYKWPTLTELHYKLFGKGFGDAHDAAYDVDATARCFFELIKVGVVMPEEGVLVKDIQYEAPELGEANFDKKEDSQKPGKAKQKEKLEKVIPFSHLHVHSQFSILQSPASVKQIVHKAKELKMPAVAITDHGNLHGAFYATGLADESIKVIIGCEFYLSKERKRHKFTKDDPDRRTQEVLIAKTVQGYKNLCKLSSIGFIEGFYAQVPRIDKDLVKEYSEGLIALTGNLYAEIPSLILNRGEEAAEEEFKWWHSIFKEDYYIELMRHGLPEEDRVNEVLLKFSEKYNVKIIASNNAYYLDKENSSAHDALLCIKDGKQMSMPVGGGRSYRFALPNDQFYFKSQKEMNQLFVDLPEAIQNTNEIVEKCEQLKLDRDILLPAFPIPEEFGSEDDYLRHLTLEGAKENYEEVDEEVLQRIDHELSIIKEMGFPGYFLIVQDFIKAAREMGVIVGPGRGSAAGSVVAYCTGITNIDPIKYNLLFERFLNPERISMPDIDIDFDDRGRQKVIDWVVEKYGKNQVAQIVTYGTMAAKMSIRDVGRVLEYPLPDTNQLAKLVPEIPGMTLERAYVESKELKEIRNKKEGEDYEVVRLAETLEGSVRNTGIHAAGVIIAPDDLTEYIPVCTSKDADLLVTQFDGKVIENAGMLKMDFLGLKTLTIIKDALDLIEQNHGTRIDIDKIPLDDPKTFELYQRGETVATFQFESEGMRMYLKDLKPTHVEDLIAMNALYRPGPMQFIPNFINRKHGKERVDYPHPLLEEILSNTYGIMVYQEQIMQTAQILAGYTLGGADLLRRAMGKKKMEEMERQRAIFVEGAKEKNDIPKEKADEIFTIMEKFAAYGFNRSHSAAYSLVAYQTAYLKANYPAEYMSAVLSNWLGNIDKISYFLEECKRMDINVLGPDVNESLRTFNANKEGNIRFGLAAIKGAGDAAVDSIIDERKEGGAFGDIWDFIERVNLRSVNKKTVESLAYAGAFDSFNEVNRAQLFYKPDGDQTTGIEKLIKHGNNAQAEKQSAQISLFGDAESKEFIRPKLPACEPWIELLKLKYEKEVVGFYLSGHPLDLFKEELDHFCVPLMKVQELKGKEVNVGGVISSVTLKYGKNGSQFALFTVEDYFSSQNMALFGETFLKNAHIIKPGEFVFIKGKVEERYNQPGQWEFSPKQLMPLADVKDKMCNKIKFQFESKSLSEKDIEEIHRLVEEFPGKCNLEFEIMDAEKNLRLPLMTRSYRVELSKEFLEGVKKIPNVEFSLA